MGFSNDAEAVVSDKLNVWTHHSDWLSIRETGSSKMTDLVKNMNAYNRLEVYPAGLDTGWASAGGSYNMSDLDSWLFGERDYEMEYLRTEETEDFTRVVFNVEENLLGVGEGSVELGTEMRYMGNTESYCFDKSGKLCAVEIVASIKNDFDEPMGWVVVYRFHDTSESVCAGRIDEVYAEVAAALGLN